jgi:Methylamine utilisation protein MauE
VSLPAAAAPFVAATVLLGAAGVAKTRRPADTANALRAAGIPANRALVRVGALAEAGVAAWALIAPGPLTGALVAAAYAIFAVFVVLALKRGWALSSCGCFGRPDTPPTVAHAVLNVGAAASAAWWAAAWPGGPGWSHLGRLFFHQPWHGLPLALVTLVVTGMAYLVWTNPLAAARRS